MDEAKVYNAKCNLQIMARSIVEAANTFTKESEIEAVKVAQMLEDMSDNDEFCERVFNSLHYRRLRFPGILCEKEFT